MFPFIPIILAKVQRMDWIGIKPGERRTVKGLLQ